MRAIPLAFIALAALPLSATGARDENDLDQHVRAGERGGAEHGRADLRQAELGLWGRKLRHDRERAVAGRALAAGAVASKRRGHRDRLHHLRTWRMMSRFTNPAAARQG